jgi:RNA polymerase sigma factor (sigma-70 family)
MKGDNESEGVTVPKVAAETKDDDGDARRLTLLFHEYQARIHQFARRRVGADAAQEIVAETFLVAWRRLHDIPDPALPWLYRVASLEVANFQRRQIKSLQVRRALRESLPSEGSPQQASDDDPDVSQVIARAFESLGAGDQEILRLATWDGLTSAEGAIVLGCSVPAYRVRLHRARSRLAKKSRLRSGGALPTQGHVKPPTQPNLDDASPTNVRPTSKRKEAG